MMEAMVVAKERCGDALSKGESDENKITRLKDTTGFVGKQCGCGPQEVAT